MSPRLGGVGIYVKGNFAQNNATAGLLVVCNCVLEGCEVNLKVDLLSLFDIIAWFNANEVFDNISELRLSAPLNLAAANPMPAGGWPLLSGADFTDVLLWQWQHDITTVGFGGAFGTDNWLLGWTNLDPQNRVC